MPMDCVSSNITATMLISSYLRFDAYLLQLVVKIVEGNSSFITCLFKSLFQDCFAKFLQPCNDLNTFK